MDPKWFNVNVKARIWSGHADSAQKQGWMYPPGAILAIDEYKGSYQFEEWKVVGDGIDDFYAHKGYDQLWVRIVDTSTETYEDYLASLESPVDEPDTDPLPVPVPVPSDSGEVSDEMLGKVIRFLLWKMFGR